MTTDGHIALIVDDHARVREALEELLASHGMRAIAHGSAGDHVGAGEPDVPGCLILDVELPDVDAIHAAIAKDRESRSERADLVRIAKRLEVPITHLRRAGGNRA